jgi:2,5-diamino-6-(ribosylamino)-4(3H)-pyrimidinone 5'-phosphate reductase
MTESRREPAPVAAPAAGTAGTPPRPRVVVSVEATVDGKITLGRQRRLMEPAVGQVWRQLQPPSAGALRTARDATQQAQYGYAQVVLEGVGSIVSEGEAPPPLPAVEGDPRPLYEDFLPAEVLERPGRQGWFAVVDSRGRARWTQKTGGGRDLLVLVARRTPPEYLAFLRKETIPYLVAGEARVDLAQALGRMAETLGVTCVTSAAGGGLNGALLRAGLIDELNILFLPSLIGGRDTPTLFDGPELGPHETPARLRLLSAQLQTDGAMWVRYEVLRPTAGV